jgi:L-amino acid N-acyltransferase YncA
MAVTVTNDWQHAGINALLIKKLIEFAKGHGVKRLYSIDLAENSSMRRLAEDMGMDSKCDPDNARQVIYSLAI